jgi:hypothetical protein
MEPLKCLYLLLVILSDWISLIFNVVPLEYIREELPLNSSDLCLRVFLVASHQGYRGLNLIFTHRHFLVLKGIKAPWHETVDFTILVLPELKK